MKKIGEIVLGETCDITDPCYDADVWCRNTVIVKPGAYVCYADIRNYDDWGKRVKRSWIIHKDCDGHKMPHNDSSLTWKGDYDCGVDAGLFGYFDDKPDFSDNEWRKFCNAIEGDPTAQISKFDGRDGFFTSSGYGDGGYYVDAYAKDGEVVALETRFI